MKHIKKIFCVLLLFCHNSIICQNNQIPVNFNNKRIKFGVYLVHVDREVNIAYSETLIGLQNLDSLDWVILRSIKKEDWLSLLKDHHYDWAANLALYEIHRKYAGIFSSINNRKKWIKHQRILDLAFWEQTLK
ncbi:MAG: hypothetical protein HYZ42_16965 [Bacteroidetes bacterium]|nr:hypothetical protein [Bacteroidota bacterium]